MTAEPQAEHIRVRPSWNCAACGQAWPCADAKEALLREFRRFPSVLTILMATQMYDAFDDLSAQGGLPRALLYERFLGWIVLRPPDEEADPADDPAPRDRPEDGTTEGGHADRGEK